MLILQDAASNNRIVKMTEPSLNILTGNADAFCTDKNQLIKSIVPIVMEYGLYDKEGQRWS